MGFPASVPQVPIVPSDLANPGAALALWHLLAPPTSGAGPSVRACMIATPDGSATVDGRSAGLQTPMDHAVYSTMRMRSDLILVSMSTVRHEGYGPAVLTPALTHLRDAAPSPIWALTRTLRQDDIDYLSQAQHSRVGGPMVLVTSQSAAPAHLRAEASAAGVALRLIPGDSDGFLAGAIAAARREAKLDILIEPGPHLLAALLSGPLLDELVLSVAPFFALPTGTPLLPAEWSGPTTRSDLRVVAAFSADDGGLYTRWKIDGSAPADESTR